MTVTTTFTIVSIIASMNKPLVRFVQVLDRYYMYINSKKAVNRLLFFIPDKPGAQTHINNKNIKTGGIELEGTDILTEDQNAMNLALSKIFGDQFDLMEEMRSANRSIRSKKMKEYSEEQVSKGREGGDTILGKTTEGEFIMGDSNKHKTGSKKSGTKQQKAYNTLNNTMNLIKANEGNKIEMKEEKYRTITNLDTHENEEDPNRFNPFSYIPLKPVVEDFSVKIMPHEKVLLLNAPNSRSHKQY